MRNTTRFLMTICGLLGFGFIPLVAGASTASAGTPDITTGLISHWKFDNTTTDSAGANNGTFTGGTPLYTTGKLSQALSFDGVDDYVQAPTASDIVFSSGDFSMGAWVKATGGSPIITKGDGSEPGNTEYIFNVNTTQALFFRGAWRNSGAFSDILNSWTHVFVVFTDSDDTLRLYKNGTLADTITSVTGPYASNTDYDLFFGKQGSAASNMYQGLIDDVRIYNRALNQGDVTALYHLGSTPNTPINCHTLDSTKPVPNGFGAAYNPLSAQKELLLTALCSTDRTDVTVGNDDAFMYAYHLGYSWDGTQWAQKQYSCTGQKVSNAWCVKKALGTVPLNDPWFIGYTCYWTGNQWKCGCLDAKCKKTNWQLQGILRGTDPAEYPPRPSFKKPSSP